MAALEHSHNRPQLGLIDWMHMLAFILLIWRETKATLIVKSGRKFLFSQDTMLMVKAILKLSS